MTDLDKQRAEYQKPDDKDRRRRRRRMNAFKMEEISSVDRPAQEPALALIMKRADDKPEDMEKRIVLTSATEGHTHLVGVNGMAREFGGGDTSFNDEHSHPFFIDDNGNIIIGEAEGHTHEVSENTRDIMIKSQDALFGFDKQFTAAQRERLAESGEAMRDGSFPIRNRSDLMNAIQAFGRADDKPAVARHIQRRARALGLSDMLPDAGRLADLLKVAAPSGGPSEEEGVAMPQEKKAADTDLTAQLDALKADLAKAQALADLNDEQKQYYKGLKEDVQAAFLAKSIDDRQAEIDLSKSADKVIYKGADGTEYRESGGVQLAAMAKRLDEQAEAFAKSEAEKDQLRYEKRAEDELKYISGTVETRVAILKSLDAIQDEALRKAAYASIQSGNNANADAFKTFGSSEINKASDDAGAELERLTKAHQEQEKVDYFTAYDAVKKAHPELHEQALKG